MIYKKTNPSIGYVEFRKMIEPVTVFKGLRGQEYEIRNIEGSKMRFIRKSKGVEWSMDLEGVLRAYKELTDFKTINFKPYVPRTHSPALGLLLHLGLLK